jgi:tetratricopeptide (TPR) repeat protein
MKSLRRFAIAAIGLPLWFATTGWSQTTNAHWTAPENPNPNAILQEAEADNRAGRYEDSLAKHVWFHENALKIQPSQYGVRLSFALSDWIELGKSYPPALEKLKSIRDEDDQKIRMNKASRDLFDDFASINDYLEDVDRTKGTFIWLDKNAPAFATEAFDSAKPALIKTKEYSLCGKYLHPESAFARIQDIYERNLKMGKDPKLGKRVLDYGKKNFSYESATLVALLVVNGRKEEAENIAAKAEKILDDPAFKALLEKAKKGEVPAPWP